MHVTTLIAGVALAALGTGAELGQIQLIQYPYGHDPELAWRLTVLPDGTWLHEESTRPVKLTPLADVGALEWVAAARQSTGHMSRKRLAALVARLRELELETLERQYSAQHTFLHPTETTLAVPAQGEEYRIPAETTRVVTHGDTYEIRISIENASVESSVYAPLATLSYDNPQHPDRQRIATLMTVWYEVLRATGPIRGIKTKQYRPYLRLREPSNSG